MSAAPNARRDFAPLVSNRSSLAMQAPRREDGRRRPPAWGPQWRAKEGQGGETSRAPAQRLSLSPRKSSRRGGPTERRWRGAARTCTLKTFAVGIRRIEGEERRRG